MPEPNPYFANLQRGAQLLNLNRPRDAVPFFEAAIAANPDHPQGYAELARALNAMGDRTRAIRTINRAIALAPGASVYFGLKSWFLICQMRHGAALNTAQKGLALNPLCYQSLNSLANAHTKLARWKEAESACLRILALNPNDPPALNLLAQALRHQGRWKDSRETVSRLLANMPNNAFGHANAGFDALAAGDHLRANEHFRESLRLNPHFDLARRGLLQSLRARIWIIRFNIRYLSWIRQPLNLLRGFIVCTTVFLFIALAGFSSAYQDTTWGKWLGAGLTWTFFGALGYLYLSGAVSLLSNFLLLFDPVGRHALTGKDKAKAVLPVLVFAFIVVIFVLAQAWLAAGIALGAFALLAFSFYYPLLKDRWERRRESQAAG